MALIKYLVLPGTLKREKEFVQAQKSLLNKGFGLSASKPFIEDLKANKTFQLNNFNAMQLTILNILL